MTIGLLISSVFATVGSSGEQQTRTLPPFFARAPRAHLRLQPEPTAGSMPSLDPERTETACLLNAAKGENEPTYPVFPEPTTVLRWDREDCTQGIHSICSSLRSMIFAQYLQHKRTCQCCTGSLGPSQSHGPSDGSRCPSPTVLRLVTASESLRAARRRGAGLSSEEAPPSHPPASRMSL